MNDDNNSFSSCSLKLSNSNICIKKLRSDQNQVPKLTLLQTALMLPSTYTCVSALTEQKLNMSKMMKEGKDNTLTFSCIVRYGTLPRGWQTEQVQEAWRSLHATWQLIWHKNENVAHSGRLSLHTCRPHASHEGSQCAMQPSSFEIQQQMQTTIESSRDVISFL